MILAVHAWTVRRRETRAAARRRRRRPHAGRAARGQWALLGGVLLSIAVLLRAAARRARRAVASTRPAATASATTAALGPRATAAPSWCRRSTAIGNSLRYAARRDRSSRWSSAGSLAAAALDPARRRAARAGLRRAADAAARGVGGHRRLRLPHHARQAAAGPAQRPGSSCRSRRRWSGVPFVVRTMLPVLRAVDDRLREAAAVLGASPLRVWREVDLPMVRRALLVAAGFAFAVSLGEFGATVFIARPDNPTLPVAVARLLGRPGELNYGQAMALATILMVVCAVAAARAGTAPDRPDPGSSDDAAVSKDATVRFGARTALDARRTSMSPSTRSCACSGPAAAASRRCCGWSPDSSLSTRDGCCSTAATSRRRARAPARGRPDVPGPPALPAAGRRRQRRLRAAHAPRTHGATGRTRTASCWTWSGCPGAAGAPSPRSPAGNSSESPSPALSRPVPGC